MEFALTFNNRSINMTDFFESVLIKETGDEFDNLRKQMNTIIVNRMSILMRSMEYRIITMDILMEQRKSIMLAFLVGQY